MLSGSTKHAAPAKVQKKPLKPSIWKWEALSREGVKKRGEMEGMDAKSVESKLKSIGFTPQKIQKKSKSIRLSIPGFSGISNKDLLIFTKQLSTMIDAGLPLVQGLDMLASQIGNTRLRTVVTQVKEKIESGSSFSEALKDHPKVFDTLFVQLCAAGEVGGILDTILERLAAYKEKAAKLARRVRGAMAYPAVVLVIAIAVVIVLLWKVTPVFAKMFLDFGSELPGPTQFVVDLSEWMQRNILYVLGVMIVVVIGFMLFSSWPKGKMFLDGLILKIPVFKQLVTKVAVARFSRTLGTLISAGVPILNALDVTANTAGNKVIEKAIVDVRNEISEGKSIAGPLSNRKVFPSMVVQMIGVGEATGALDQMLTKIADFYDDEVDVAVGGLTALIEPLMMVVVGGIVGGFLIAMYLPVFSLVSAVQ
ncbi:MAG: type II secretion system F family protein [Cystobacterineae bacterium]|nr:type II secretion system F family protein [Cystobacterineae bacterium]